jgi:hypothetical protein
MLLYRHLLGDAGAWNIRLLEGREDFVIPIALNKYPARSVRYGMTCGFLARTLKGPYLISATVNTSFSRIALPVIKEEVVVRSEEDYDEVDDTFMAHIVVVTNYEKSHAYFPTYNFEEHRLYWDTAEAKPNAGEVYLVLYLAYTSEPEKTEISFEDLVEGDA